MGLAQLTRIGGRPAVVDGELLDLDRRAKHGDPVAGWRGDPSMHTFVLEREDSWGRRFPAVQVCGIDAHGDTYVACEVDASKQGWKHDALTRLVKGDWQRGGLTQSVEDHNAKVDADRAAAFNDQLENEIAPKLEWALRRDGADIRNKLFVARDFRKKGVA